MLHVVVPLSLCTNNEVTPRVAMSHQHAHAQATTYPHTTNDKRKPRQKINKHATNNNNLQFKGDHVRHWSGTLVRYVTHCEAGASNVSTAARIRGRVSATAGQVVGTRLNNTTLCGADAGCCVAEKALGRAKALPVRDGGACSRINFRKQVVAEIGFAGLRAHRLRQCCDGEREDDRNVE
jgi:hypothetical protein